MKFEQELIFENYTNRVLVNEGGAAGHMLHPFDLPDVTSGHTLIDKFKETIRILDDVGGSIKIDGTNVSFKLITGENGVKQFALDRGSMSELDVNGVTIEKLPERFLPQGGTPHGMVAAGRTLLTIMNQSLPYISDELRKLGLWEDPTKFINAEFVQGTTNVVEYDKDFLAFHGINQFLEKHNRQGELVRPGLQREQIVDPVTGQVKLEKGGSKAVPYSQEALDQLAEQVKPIAKNYNFEILTKATIKKKGHPNFNTPLSQNVSIKISDKEEEADPETGETRLITNEEVITQPLRDWLDSAINPRDYMLTTVGGRKERAVGKTNYLDVIDSVTTGKPLNKMYIEQDIEPAINGAMIYHATKELGNELLKHYTSVLGDANTHEGIVVPTSPPYKITGEFIIQGMQSKFRQAAQADEDDQSAPGVNFGKGYQNVNAQSANYAASSKDPGGTPYTRYPGPGKGAYLQ